MHRERMARLAEQQGGQEDQPPCFPKEKGWLFRMAQELMARDAEQQGGQEDQACPIAKARPPVKQAAIEAHVPKRPATRVVITKRPPASKPLGAFQPAKPKVCVKKMPRKPASKPYPRPNKRKPAQPAAEPPPHLLQGNQDPSSRIIQSSPGTQAPAVKKQIEVQLLDVFFKILN